MTIHFKFDVNEVVYTVIGAKIAKGRISSVSYKKEQGQKAGVKEYFLRYNESYRKAKEHDMFSSKEECLRDFIAKQGMTVEATFAEENNG